MEWARPLRAAIFLLLAGCVPPMPPPEPRPDLCESPWRSDPAAPSALSRVELLLRGYDPATRTVTSPPLDCTGAQVRWDGPVFACSDSGLASTALSARPLGAEDVISAPARNEHTLLWVPTARYASGDAAGPVALVKEGEHRSQVVHLGVLRAYPRNARLRLESLGGVGVLVAEGESCAGDDPAGCVRAARIVPLLRSRFTPQSMVDADGRCLSPAWVELYRSETRRIGGRPARVELTAALQFTAAGLDIDEQVVVQEVAGKPGGPPPRTLHRAQAIRTVRWRDGKLVASGPSLWVRMGQGW